MNNRRFVFGCILISILLFAGLLHAEIIYVKSDAIGANNGTDWTNAYLELKTALLSANSGDQIWVAAGIYMPTTDTDRDSTFHLKSGVEIYGGFSGVEANLSQRDWETNVTILSGDIGDTASILDNCYHVVSADSVDNTAILDGFTITEGNADGTSDSPRGSGGGLFNTNGDPIIRNIIFIDNHALDFGGGMYNQEQSNPIVVNCQFINNSTYSKNGGGMYNFNSAPLVSHTIFKGNSAKLGGGGMYNRSSTPKISNCVFSGNRALTYTRDDVGRGGGMYNNDSSPIIKNCTFSGNRADLYGGGMYNVNISHPNIANSIFWNNRDGGGIDVSAQIHSEIGNSPTINYSNIQGGWTGSGGDNINLDPLFVTSVDPNSAPTTSGNLRVQRCSPVLDAGDNALLPLDFTDVDSDSNTTEVVPLDLDGNQRIFDGDGSGDSLVDMGAYELQEEGIVPDIVTEPANGDTLQFNNAIVGFYTRTDSVKIKNIGCDTLIIDSLTIADTTNFKPDLFPTLPLAISPGDSSYVKVLFSPSTPGIHTTRLQISQNDPDLDSLFIGLKGEATPPLPDIMTVPDQNDTLKFGSLIIIYTKNDSIEIQNIGLDTLRIDSLLVSGSAFSLMNPLQASLPQNIEPDSSLWVTIKFSPTAVDTFFGKLTIKSNDPDEDSIFVNLHGIGAPTEPYIQTNPSHGDTLDFGHILINDTKIDSIKIKNIGTDTLQIDSLRIIGSGFQVIAPTLLPQRINPEDSIWVKIEFFPTMDSTYIGALLIKSDAVNQDSILIGLKGIGEPPTPGISTDPAQGDTLKFGEIPVNTTKIDSIQVLSIGTDSLVIDSLGIDGATFSIVDAPTLPKILQIGDILWIKVEFAPTIFGNYTGALTIKSDDPNDSLTVVHLLGTGLSSEIAIHPDSLDFGIVYTDTWDSLSLQILNTGNSDLVISDINSDSTAFELVGDSAFTVLPGDSQAIMVRFRPRVLGSNTGTFTIYSNDPYAGTTTFGVKGYFAQPRISTEPTEDDTLDFGEVALFTTEIDSIKVKNLGTHTLEISNFNLSGTAFTVLSPTLPITINPNDSLWIKVDFEPLSSQDYLETLSIQNNDPTNDTVFIYLKGAGRRFPIYVDADAGDGGDGSSWANAFNDLQAALDIATKSNDIWVAEGAYFPSQPIGREATFQLVSGTRLFGGFDGTETDISQRDWLNHQTILSGDIGTIGDNSDNCYIVVTASNTNENTVLDGFIIEKGNANVSPYLFGAGIYNYDGNLKVRNCILQDNIAKNSGAAMYNRLANPTITHCIIRNNAATVKSATGGAFYNYISDLNITNSTFVGNSAANVGYGGAIYNYRSDLVISNCSFSQNEAGYRGAALYNYDQTNVTVNNSIFWDNTSAFGNQIYNFSSTAAVNYSVVQGGYPGTGNLDVDPLFADADLHLGACSPAIDAGDNGLVSADVSDVDMDNDFAEMTPYDVVGNPRLFDGDGDATVVVDMGAYEMQEDLVTPEISITPTDGDTIKFGGVTVDFAKIDSIKIENFGCDILRITDLQLTDPNFILPDSASLPININPPPDVNNFYWLKVGFFPNSLGDKSGTLIIKNDDLDEDSLNVHLTGTGLMPLISITPDSLNFGKTPVNSPDTLSIKVRNYGVGALEVKDFRFGNSGQFILTDNSQFILDSGDSTWLNVIFDPALDNDLVSDTLHVISTAFNDVDSLIKLVGISIQPPTLSLPDTIHMEEDIPQTIIQDLTLYAVDQDGQTDSISWYIHSFDNTKLDSVKMVGDSVVIYPSQNENGDSWVKLAAIDPDSLETIKEIILAIEGINDPPMITDIPTQYTNEDTAKTVAFTIGDPEIPSENLSIWATSSNQTLVPDGNVLLSGADENRTITLTPQPDQFGTTTISIFVSDSEITVKDTFLLVVNPVNDPPTISPIPDQITNKNVPVTVHFTINDVDNDFSDLILSGTADSLVPDSGFVFDCTDSLCSATITPGLHEYGVTTVTINVNDGGIIVGESFQLTINMVNTPPLISDIPDQFTEEDSSITVNFTIDDVETQPESLSLWATSSDTTLLPNDNLILGGSGSNRSITLIPAPNMHGITRIIVTVADFDTTTTDTFFLTVDPVNDSPMDLALSDTTTIENQPIGTVVGTFSTSDIDTEDVFTYSLVTGIGSEDNSLFTISGNTLLTAAILDYEVQENYSIRVRTDDNNGGILEKVFHISLTNLDVIFVNDNAMGLNNGLSWTNAYTSLKTALSRVTTGDTIWVAQGTYKPTSGTDRNASFQLKNQVGIYGGFAGTETSLTQRNLQVNQSILSGNIGDLASRSDNSYHVIKGSGTNNTAVLDGFIITDGNADATPPADNSNGGGMFNDIGSPTVRNCTFQGNFATNGAGMYNKTSSNPIVTNCIFSGNLASIGAGMSNISQSNPVITNCTFSGNRATENSGAMRNGMSQPVIRNSIFWNNSPDQIYDDSGSDATVNYSIVQNGWSGNGENIINSDPLFVAPIDPALAPTNTGDFHLSPCSPAIEVGDNALATHPIDRDGNPRLFDGDGNGFARIDLGAYEMQSDIVNPDISIIPENNTLSFGSVLIYTEKIDSILVKNLGCDTLNITDLQVSVGDFSLQDSLAFPEKIEVGDSMWIKVKFAPTELGFRTGKIFIYSDDPDENPVSVTLMGSCYGQPKISLNVDSLYFGRIPAGTLDTLKFSVTNIGLEDLTISDYSFGNSSQFIFPALLPITLTPDSTLDMEIIFAPFFERDLVSDTLTLISDAANAPDTLLQISGFSIQPPEIDVPDNRQLTEDVSSFLFADLDSFLVRDQDGQLIETWEIVEFDTTKLETVQLLSGNSVWVEPKKNMCKESWIKFRAIDPDSLFSVDSAMIYIKPVNDPPKFAELPDYGMEILTPLNYQVVANDPDPDDTLRIEEISWFPLPDWIILTDNGDGTALLQGTPALADTGLYTIYLQVTDSENVTDWGDFELLVVDSNEPPVATEQVSLITDEDVPIDLDLRPLATDVDNNPLSWSVVAGDVNSIDVEIFGDTLAKFTPALNIYGNFEIFLEVFDGISGRDTTKVSITVNSIDDIPYISMPDTFLYEDTSLTFDLKPYINDVETPDSLLYIAAIVLPATRENELTVIIGTDGFITLKPKPDWCGAKRVAFTVLDEGGNISRDTMRVDVICVNDPPEFSTFPDSLHGVTGHLYQYELAASDVDVGDTLIFDGTIPDWLTLVDNGNRTATLMGTPDSSHLGAHTVQLTVTDTANVTAYQNFTITVLDTVPINYPPEFISQPDTNAYANQEYLYSISASDPEGDSLHFNLLLSPTWLDTLIDYGDNTALLKGTPTTDDTASTHLVKIRVMDIFGKIAYQEFTIKVNPTIIYSADVNRDGKVDILDLQEVISRYKLTPLDEGYKSECDLDKNNVIDMRDARKLMEDMFWQGN